ncbi:TIGR02647 family protein [Flavobacterium sp. W21_SRS_FM6]|uniref:TIGR02647 family protein n=1 Tax=Flavobacterium sp. W21_SRS_FM6 TaxID=3240268 RepID=UPI003F9130BB
MMFTSETMNELNLLLKFPDTSLMQGIKVHHDADPELVAASKRLFDKGIVTLPDGGYLTDLGHDLLEHAKIINSAFAVATE